jgi:hypothetical protein
MFPTTIKARAGIEMLQKCEAFLSTTNFLSGNKLVITKEGFECWGYMEAIQDMVVMVDRTGKRLLGVCAPEESTLVQLIRIYVNYGRKNATELHNESVVVVLKALGDAFPCPKE